jgi:thioredoxin-related protein
MKFNSIILSVLFFVGTGLIYQSCISEASANTHIKTIETKRWTTLENAIELSRKNKKKILVNVYTDWCKWGKVMDEKTFQNKEIKSYLVENYHLVKFNAEQKEEATFKGKAYYYASNGRRGTHSLAAELLAGQLSYPSLVVLDSDLSKLQTLRGCKSPEQLSELLDSN